MWFKYSITALLIFASVPGCSRQNKPRTITAPTEVARVRVSADGSVYLNERVVTLKELRGELQRLKQVHGGVQFVDESSAADARQQAQRVSAAIVEFELPMQVKRGG